MLKIILIKFVEYSLILVIYLKKNKVSSNKYNSKRKIRNKIIEILAKSQNLPKFKSRNLFKFKNFIKI